MLPASRPLATSSSRQQATPPTLSRAHQAFHSARAAPHAASAATAMPAPVPRGRTVTAAAASHGGPGGGDGRSGGSPAGGGGGEGGGDKGGPLPSPFPFGSWLCRALVSYTGLLFGATSLWDLLMDGTAPRLDTTTATVSVIIPAVNEGLIIAEAVRYALQDLQPTPCEVIVVDGGSNDGTALAAQRAGARVVHSKGRGRGLQMNAGAEVAKGELLLFLHADTRLTPDAVAQVRAALAVPRTVLVGFRPLILDGDRPMWFSTANNFAKTYYGPILCRPASYVRGLRMMFGDQALCCRAVDLHSVGGYRSDIPFMEDADLCIDLHMAGPAHKGAHKGRGRVRMLLDSPAATSGRRIAAWGELRANGVFAYVSLLWLAGASPAELQATYRRLYHDVR